MQKRLTVLATSLLALLAAELACFAFTQAGLKSIFQVETIKLFGIDMFVVLPAAFGIADLGIMLKFGFEDETKNYLSGSDFYLIGAWILAQCLAAMIVWAGITQPMIAKHITSPLMPVMVAVVVWGMRVLLVAWFSFVLRKLLGASMATSLAG